MRLDLHVHTVASDGAWTPEEVVEGAVSGRLDVIAVSDHDTTAGVEPAAEAAEGHNLQVVPAAELSSTREGRELHILGYWVDPAAPALAHHEKRAVELRRRRMEGMIARLARRGVDVRMEDVVAAAGADGAVLARPHLARVMVSEGYVATVPEAFDRYIGDQHPAFLPTELADPAEAIRVIEEAGGIAVWAHPPHDIVEEVLPELIEAGLRGVEVYRPRSHPRGIRRLESIARSAGLLVSGGSDWHDPDRNEPLGDFWVTADEVGPLLEAGGL